jgi:hypothetical protein
MQIHLSTPRLRNLLLGLVGVLMAVGTGVEICDHLFSPAWAPTAVPLLSLSYEHNLPTWVVVCLLFCCALLLAAIAAHARRRGARHVLRWRVLALLFAYISFDELVQIHERMSDWFETGGVLYFGWVIPAGIAVLLLGIYFLPLLRDLPAPMRRRFVTAGALYVTGALLLELPLGYWTERAGPDNLTYALIDALEEGLELLGVSLFLCALVDHLAGDAGHIAVSVDRDARRALHDPPDPTPG